MRGEPPDCRSEASDSPESAAARTSGNAPAAERIKVVRALRDIIRGGRIFMVVRFATLDGATREATLAMRDFWTLRAFKDRMVDEDFPLPDDSKEVKQLHDRLKRHARQAAKDPSRRLDATPLQGWHGDKAFVCGDRVLLEDAPVVFLAADGVTYPRVEQRGTFKGWLDGVATLLPCSSRLMLEACGGLASALLRVWRGTLKGFGFNLSGASRQGKSLGLRLVCSTIGPPDLEGWNHSRSGIAERLMGHRGLPLVLDDTADARPDGKGTASIVDQVTGLVALGRPDGLHHGAVGELQKAGVGFQSILLSTTEGALPPRRRGLQARLVEIPLPANGFGIIDFPELCQPLVCDAASAGCWVEAADQAMKDHHGHVYPRFVRGLLKLRPAFGQTPTTRSRVTGDAFLSRQAPQGRCRLETPVSVDTVLIP